MKKRIFAILIALVVFALPFVSAHAETSMYVLASDDFLADGYLTEDDLVDGNVEGIRLESEYGYAVTIAIIDSALISYYTSAESLYYEMTDNPDGIILVHNVYDEEIDYYLAGDCEYVFEDYIIGIANAYDVTSTYAEGITAYYNAVESVVAAYSSTPSYDDEVIEAPAYGGEDNAESEEMSEALPAVIDDAGLLKDSEIKDFDEKLRNLSKENNVNFVFITLEETGGITLNEYADMVYEYCGYKDTKADGTVLFIYQHADEGEREIVIVRYGDVAQEMFSDADCDTIINTVKDEFAEGNYAEGFEKTYEEFDRIINPSVHWIWIPLCLIIGFVIAFVIMKIIASANKSVRMKANAIDYIRPNSLLVTDSNDIFLYSELKTSAKASNNTTSSNTDGGGRSTSSGKF